MLHLVHLPDVDWQGSKWPAQIAVSSIVIWRWTGYNALIYLAGMQAIDYSLYEAAAMDGAGRWRQFLHVTLPGLRPTILFTIVVSTIGAAQLFGEPLLYHNGLPDGGTQNQYQTLGLLMYQQGWANDRLGLASATAWTMFVIIVVAVLANLGLARRRRARVRLRSTRRSSSTRPSRCDASGADGGAGRQRDGSRVTYALVALVTLVSVFPLYYTIVMASHTNAEMAAARPPILPSLAVFDNLKDALRARAAQPAAWSTR